MFFVFSISFFFIFYAYVGYPLSLLFLSNGFNRPNKKKQITPHVTLIISAYNEENIIENKIENTLSLDYPSEKLEILVVSDGSTDKTEEIANKFASRGVTTIRVEGRVGKTSCLNAVVPKGKGEIIIFSDANSMYCKNAIMDIVKNFEDEKIGFVTGFTKYVNSDSNTDGESVGLYSKIEKLTKLYESKIGSCVGADGAIFAIRKNLYIPLKITDINDFVIPLNIIKQKYRGILEPAAFCNEATAKGDKGEFKRQVRITNRTLRAIINNRQLLNIANHGFFSFQLFSHKICKFIVPFFLFFLGISNLMLIGETLFFKIFLIMQCLFYMFAIFHNYIHNKHAVLFRIGKICNTFLIVNIAILFGWFSYLKGENYIVWESLR